MQQRFLRRTRGIWWCSRELPVGAVAAVGVAAVAALEVVSGGEDEVRALEVEVFWGKLGGWGRGFAGCGCDRVAVFHC